jgi:hypothetical protein
MNEVPSNSSMHQSEQSALSPLLRTIISLFNPSVIVARFSLSAMKQISLFMREDPRISCFVSWSQASSSSLQHAKRMSSIFQPVSAHLNIVRPGELQTACVVETVLISARRALTLSTWVICISLWYLPLLTRKFTGGPVKSVVQFHLRARRSRCAFHGFFYYSTSTLKHNANLPTVPQ